MNETLQIEPTDSVLIRLSDLWVINIMMKMETVWWKLKKN